MRAVDLQTLNQFSGVGSVAGKVDQGKAEATVGERFPGFGRRRDGNAQVSTDPQKAEESQLCCRVDLDHERSALGHLATPMARFLIASRRRANPVPEFLPRASFNMLLIFHGNPSALLMKQNSQHSA